MTQIPSNIPLTTTPNQTTQTSSTLRDVDLDQFLHLMIAELQNQDPLDPLDNSELLQQISQLREIAATDQLTDTLDAVLNGQNLATAGSLIGKYIDALDDNNQTVQGAVDRVALDVDATGTRRLRLHVGESAVQLKNIRQILDADNTDGSQALEGGGA